MTNRTKLQSNDFPFSLKVKPQGYIYFVKFRVKNRSTLQELCEFMTNLEVVSQDNLIIKICIDGNWVNTTRPELEHFAKQHIDHLN